MRRVALAAACAAAVLGTTAAPAVAAPGYLGKWGSIGEGPGQFKELEDVATYGPYVYTLEQFGAGDGRVQKFTADGKLVRQFGRPQDEDKHYDTDQIRGAFYYPNGIATGPDGNVYVSEDGSDRTRISVWSPRGKFLRSFGAAGTGVGQIANGQGLAVDGSGTVFVGDSSRVGVFTAAGVWRGAIGESVGFAGSDDPEFDNVSDVALSGGRLFGGDFATVKVWNTNNTPVGGFGANDAAPDFTFGTISSLAFSGSTLYVADQSLSRVQSYAVNGTNVAYTGPVGSTPGGQPGQFTKPTGVATDCRGTVYVADAGNFRLQKFGAKGAKPCGSVAKDRDERFRLKLGGKARQRFATNFAVRPVVTCDRVCSARLTGSIKIKGRRGAVKLTAERQALEYPDPTGINLAPSEKGTDVVSAAVRRHRSVVARVKLVARDLTGRKRTLTRSYRLR